MTPEQKRMIEDRVREEAATKTRARMLHVHNNLNRVMFNICEMNEGTPNMWVTDTQLIYDAIDTIVKEFNFKPQVNDNGDPMEYHPDWTLG